MSARPMEQADLIEEGTFHSDDELIPSPRSEVGATSSSRVLTPKRMLAVALGALGVVGCGYVMTHSASAEVTQQHQHVSARALLEHPEFLDAASNNILTLGRGLLDDKADKLRPAAAKVMKKVSELMQEHDPEGARYLESIKLSPHQRGSVVSVVKAMSNKKVQDVGHQVLQIAYEHKDEKDGFKTTVEKVQQTFAPHASELEDLKKEVVPASMRESQDKSNVHVDIKERRLATCHGDTSKCNPGSELTSSMGKGMNMKVEDALGIVGGVLEQARLALDASSVIGTSFHSQTHVPWFVRSLVGGAAYGVETMDCFMRQDDQHKLVHGKEVLTNANSGKVNSVKMAMCPMKYAGAAMDMLSGANDVAGVQNNRLPSDFQMMFGGQPQQPQAGYNAGYNAYGTRTNMQPAQQQMFPFGLFPQAATTTLHPMVQQMRNMQNMAMMAHHAMAGNQAVAQPTHQFAYNR